MSRGGFTACCVFFVLLAAHPASAARNRQSLIYSRFDFDPGEWRYFEFPSKEHNARLEVEFDVQGNKRSSGVRVAVLAKEEFAKFRASQPHREVKATAYHGRGTLRALLAEPGDYVVVIDNGRDRRDKSQVDLKVTLTTGPDPADLPVSYASRGKRIAVTSVSLLAFFVIVALSGQALWRAAKRRPKPAPPLTWS